MKPNKGIATDAAHSMKNQRTIYRGIDLASGDELFFFDLGKRTVNIGEFLGVVQAAKYIIENDYPDKIIYTDSMTAISWFNNKTSASKMQYSELQKAEIYLRVMEIFIKPIQLCHWDNKKWGETPADFGNKK